MAASSDHPTDGWAHAGDHHEKAVFVKDLVPDPQWTGHLRPARGAYSRFSYMSSQIHKTKREALERILAHHRKEEGKLLERLRPIQERIEKLEAQLAAEKKKET